MSLAITGDIIKSAIARKIISTFTVDGVKPVVYKEQVKQGFKYPSFFIYIYEVTQWKRLGNVYDRDYRIEVRYVVKEDDVEAYGKLDDMGNLLMLALSSIEVPIAIGKDELGYIEGKKTVKNKSFSRYIKDENILLYKAKYSITLKYFEDGVKMKDMMYKELIV